MSIKKNRILLSLISSISFLPRFAIAKIPMIYQPQLKNSNLSAQLLDQRMFLIDPNTSQIILNEAKILQQLQNEINSKLEDPLMEASERAMYKKLIENLKPGNFEATNANSEKLRSMDFSKGN